MFWLGCEHELIIQLSPSLGEMTYFPPHENPKPEMAQTIVSGNFFSWPEGMARVTLLKAI